MKLYNLGKTAWPVSQLAYHALAYLGREALVLVQPADAYVCLGYHQDMEQELDLAYCRANSLPVFRREVGGGAVLLDQGQVFWQLVLHPKNPLAPRSRQAFYRKFLEPVQRAYGDLGMPAEFAPVSDLLVKGKKVCGTGAGEVGDCHVFVGNLIRDFDFQRMSRVLKLPDRDFRRRVERGLSQNLTSMSRELDDEAKAHWDGPRLMELLAFRFAELLGELEPAGLDGELRAAMDRLAMRMLDPQWVRYQRKANSNRSVKLRAGVFVRQNVIQTEAGEIRANFNLEQDRLQDIRLNLQPETQAPVLNSLTASLEGAKRDQVPALIAQVHGDASPAQPGLPDQDALLRLFKA